VLPAAHRLTDGDGFRRTVRSGRRAGGRTLVVHLAVDPDPATPSTGGPRIGFVVSRAVGNAVARNRVKRRLRHLAGEQLGRLASLPGSVVLVVRALPAAAGATYAELGADLDRCLDRAQEQALRPPAAGDPTTARTR